MSSEIIPYSANQISRNELMETIKFTNEIMSCEGKKLTDLLNILHQQKNKGSKLHWILEIEFRYNLFELRKIKFDNEKNTLNEFSGFIYKKITPMHEILSIILMKH